MTSTSLTIAEIIPLWKAEKKLYVKRSTVSTYTLLIQNHILPTFGCKKDICEDEVQKFVLEKLNSGLSAKSTKDVIIVLKMILRYGAKYKYIDAPLLDIKYPTERERHKLEVLTRAQQKTIMAYIKENFTFRNIGIYICLTTGLRIGEICALRWQDINTDLGVISVRQTIQRIYIIEETKRHTELSIDSPKTKNSIRDVPMSAELLKMLKPLKKVINDDYYLLTNEEKPTEPRTYRNYYHDLMAKLKMPILKFHGLRHSFATRCIESNGDYKTVSVILGHSNISTTLNLYVHPNEEQKRAVINKMLKGL